MDPYDLEFKERRGKGRKERPEEPWNVKLVGSFRRHILQSKSEVEWVIKENLARTFSVAPSIVGPILIALTKEGLLAGPQAIPVDHENIVFCGRSVCWHKDRWVYSDTDYVKLSRWGRRGHGMWMRGGLPYGRQLSKRNLAKLLRKRRPMKCDWDGTGFIILRSSTAFVQALAAETEKPAKESNCARCGMKLPFNGKNAKRRRGHSSEECDARLVRVVMEA